MSLFDCIQSLDRESLATELEKCAAARNRLADTLPVLLEFRTGEDSKSGFTNPDDLFRAAELILGCNTSAEYNVSEGCPSLSVRGLMTIAPYTDEEGVLRSAFRRMVKIRQELENRYSGCLWSCLSMGMSNDFEIAIEEGSTMVRIGTAIFGEGF